MKAKTCDQLDDLQYLTMMLSMHIRNKLESFHVDNQISDQIMPELNSSIRYAIYDFFEKVETDDHLRGWLEMMIPDYWEIPGRDPEPTFTGEYLWQGKPRQTDVIKG